MSASPVVYFIDDSATMREVIKIAFRRENINVIVCHDAGSALDIMGETAPDVVISDVIMPEKDGYELCQYIKQHPRLGNTPVILMSGVVNRSVAERAFAVKADELIRKPFQPQDLITRVRHLLQGKAASRPEAQPANAAATQAAAMAALSSIFQTPAISHTTARPPFAVISRQGASKAEPMMSVAPPPALSRSTLTALGVTPAANESGANAASTRVPNPPGHQLTDPVKLRIETLRLQSQVKKLEAELSAERDYARALEEHIKTLQEAE